MIFLLLTLGFLFFKSFDPASVLFANDAPLGALRSQESTAIQNFSGAWEPLNWIGLERPSALPNVTYTFYLLCGALNYAKFFVPFTLFLLGFCVWFFFRQLGFSTSTSVLAGLAGALNTDPFSMGCWGLAPITVAIAASFAAMGMIASDYRKRTWMRYCLAGACVGMGVMEGYDVGAILSLYVAAFVLFQAWIDHKSGPKTATKGAFRLALVAVFAALLAASALSTLIGTQIKGIVGTQQDTESKEQRWNEATLWSLPRIEALRVIIPGVFGYRMDTPDGGNYWGAVGQQQGWEQHHQGQARHSGTGVYAGILVGFIAAWAFFKSLKTSPAIFTDSDRRFIWFWSAMALISLVLAFGWHTPFYRIVYQLPYFSTIRNPIKFMHPFSIAIVVLFGYGLEGLHRLSLEKRSAGNTSMLSQFKSWWPKAHKEDRRWVIFSVALLGISALGTLIFISSRSEMERHLSSIGFPNESASQIFHFVIGELGWFLLFLSLSVVLVSLILGRTFSGPRLRWASLLLGIVLVCDLSRADKPWIVYYNYHEKYARNSVLDLLREKPFEHRVTGRFIPLQPEPSLISDPNVSGTIYYGWWLQHLFQYYTIQSIDIIQMPRAPEMDSTFLRNFVPASDTNLFPIVRLWQLTGTQYQIGDKGRIEILNRLGDPLMRRFRIHASFDFVPKSNAVASPGGIKWEDITTEIKPDGHYAVAEFADALPRAKLYTDWRNVTSEEQTLKALADPNFNPQQTVLVLNAAFGDASAGSTNVQAGKVEITNYAPKRVQLTVQASAPAVLLLNDRFAPDWTVSVDGKTQPLLRCNFIMRGVSVPPGNHLIEFNYRTDAKGLYASLAAIGLSFVFGAASIWGSRSRQAPAAAKKL
ncbi:MAG: hypothetical protein JWM99_975 [Verrucomicrobiales bacterium]|nr:hypothetical protein [Verrucomicrobiales bacterium]